MEDIEEILSLNVSYQANAWSEISVEPTIGTILDDIKSDKYRTQINKLRIKLNDGDKEYYDNYKKQLPGVTFSATFNQKRTSEKLKTYNFLIVIDIDKLEPDELVNNYNQILNDEYVISFWRSPSNKGFKGLVSIELITDKNENSLDILHKSAFKKLSLYFLDNYNIELDQSGSDITRLCFLSYDKELILKTKFKKFEISNEDIILLTKTKNNKNIELRFLSNKDRLNNPLGKNSHSDRKIMTDIIRYLTNKKMSITDTYDQWCKVAMAIANSFTYNVGLNYFLKLSSLDINKYNKVSCTNFLNDCYQTRKGNINFNSIVYLANQKGYKTKDQRNGVPKTEE